DNLRDMIKNIENIVPENPSIDLLERIQQSKQNDIQLSETLENQRQEHSDELIKVINDKQNEFDIILKEIKDENTYLKSQIEEIEKLKNSSIQLLKDEHEKTLEVLHTQFNNK
ncbi:unnamed protein product, partial [Adineta steineri]